MNQRKSLRASLRIKNLVATPNIRNRAVWSGTKPPQTFVCKTGSGDGEVRLWSRSGERIQEISTLQPVEKVWHRLCLCRLKSAFAGDSVLAAPVAHFFNEVSLRSLWMCPLSSQSGGRMGICGDALSSLDRRVAAESLGTLRPDVFRRPERSKGRFMSRTFTTLLAILLCASPGCQKKNEATVATTWLAGGTIWELTDIVLDGKPHKALPGGEARITFDRTEFNGSTGGNSFGGPYTADPTGLITFEEISMTEMDPDIFTEQEERFIEVFSRATHYKLGANSLVLSDGTANNELRYKKFIPSLLPLTGRTWTLTHFTESDGDSESATRVQQESPITLRIDDGKGSGHGGCNGFFCEVELLEGRKLKISGLGQSTMACKGDIDDHEVLYFRNLPRMTGYSVIEKVMILSNDDGTLGMHFSGGGDNNEK